MKKRKICSTCLIDRILLGFPRGSEICWFCIRVNETTGGIPFKALKIKVKDLRPPKRQYKKLPDDPILRQKHRKKQQFDSNHRKYKEKIASDRGYLEILLRMAAHRSKKFGWAFDLTPDDLLPLPTHCPVFGFELTRGNETSRDTSPSLDRVDPTKGYVKGNVVIISMRANRTKSDLSLTEIRSLAFYCENPPIPCAG